MCKQVQSGKGLPDMMSAPDGGRGSKKSGQSKGGCVNYMLQIRSKCGQGGGGQKIQKFCGHPIWKPPYLNELVCTLISALLGQKNQPILQNRRQSLQKICCLKSPHSHPAKDATNSIRKMGSASGATRGQRALQTCGDFP